MIGPVEGAGAGGADSAGVEAGAGAEASVGAGASARGGVADSVGAGVKPEPNQPLERRNQAQWESPRQIKANRAIAGIGMGWRGETKGDS